MLGYLIVSLKSMFDSALVLWGRRSPLWCMNWSRMWREVVGCGGGRWQHPTQKEKGFIRGEEGDEVHYQQWNNSFEGRKEQKVEESTGGGC